MSQEKVAVVTGASSGIGKALASLLAKKYSKLFLLGRNRESLEVIQEDLKGDKAEIELITIDLNSESEIKTAVQLILTKTDEVHLLVNNAGLSQRAIAADMPMEIEKKLFQINYFGPVLLTKLLLPTLRKSNGAKVVLVTSIAGKFGYALRSTYSAAKHALHGYFESMRFEEEKHGVEVLFSVPGRVKTAVSQNALTANGVAYQQMDKGQAEGISAESCAAEIIKQIDSGKKEVLIGGKEILMVHFKKLFPWLFFRLAKNELKKDGSI